MKLSDQRSIIALDSLNRGLAYVFFEGGCLLDWGMRSLRGQNGATSAVDTLIDGCAADVLVLEDPDAPGCRLGPRARALLREIEKHTRRRGVQAHTVARDEVRRSWAGAGFPSRETIAPIVATRFVELQPLVLPRRKIHRTESDRAHIFDAMTLLLHRFSSIERLLDR